MLIHDVQYMRHCHVLYYHIFSIHGSVSPYTLNRDSNVWDGIHKVQVFTARRSVAAVRKAGRLFTWVDGSLGYLSHNNITSVATSCGQSQTWQVCWAVHCMCFYWILPFITYWLIWISTYFLRLHYPRYCHSAISSQILTCIVIFLMDPKIWCNSCCEGLKKNRLLISCLAYKRSRILDLRGFFWEGCSCFS